MGPITLIDKSTIQSFGFEEVKYLDRYYSLVISPILMRELLSTLAKEPKKNKDWENVLSILAAKVDTFNSYIPPNALQIARASMLGEQTPMDGRVPLSGGRKVRSRDGTYGIIFDEPEEKKILRDWQQKNFHDYYRLGASTIRKIDHEVDLAFLQKNISEQLAHFPNLKTLPELARWLDEIYFNSASPEYHLKSMALGLITSEELKSTLTRWSQSKQSISEFAPYAFYFYRVNTLYFIGLGKSLISASKKAKTHLDIQYMYYFPFSMCFTSSDKFLLEVAQVFKRDNQIVIPGEELRVDLKAISNYFSSLNDEEHKKCFKELGVYPPDLVESITNATWKALMSPRPDPTIATPKLSKQQEKDLVDRLNKYLHEAVLADTLSSSIKETQSRPMRSLSERNLAFLSGTLEKVGISESKKWENIKKEFGPDHVKSIYNLHADLWHPTDPFSKLAAELTSENKLRALYLGDIEPCDLVQQVLRWSLHFDQILIPDPFQSPWALKEEYNPIANPEQFESDTLKLVYALVLLYPFILSGQVLLVPDPSNYDLKLKALMLHIGMKKKDNPIYKDFLENEKDRINKLSFQTSMRIIARLSIEKRRKAVQSKFPELKESDVLTYFEHIRAADPLCIDRDSKEGQMIISRSGANFESSLLLSSLYGAVPVSPLTCRVVEYRQQSTPVPELLIPLATKLETTPNCRMIDPLFSVFAKEKGAVASFRDCLRQSIYSGGRTQEYLDELFVELEDEAKFLAEVYSHSFGINGEDLVEKTKIELVWSNSHFLTSDAIEYIEAYDPALKQLAPICFLGVPPTNVPPVPFLHE